jgi:formylglycine-generating enzyme required for sulfatase activity
MTVSAREYDRFLSATGHMPPRGWMDSNFADPEQPVVGVSWFDAQPIAAGFLR